MRCEGIRDPDWLKVKDVDADIDDSVTNAPCVVNVAAEREVMRSRSSWPLHDPSVVRGIVPLPSSRPVGFGPQPSD
jgi:hypothetical protein